MMENLNGNFIKSIILLPPILGFIVSTLGFLISLPRRSVFISTIFSILGLLISSFLSIKFDANFDFIYVDKFTRIFWVFIPILGIFSILFINSEISAKRKLSFEIPYLVNLSTIGGMFLVSSREFLTLFISKELLSFPIYALQYTLMTKENIESALKYFISSAIFSLIFLLGFGIFVISEGHTYILPPENDIGIIGAILIFSSFVFKSGTAPLHFWVPDVYQGAPSSVAGFASSVVKVSAFGVIWRLLPLYQNDFLFQAIAVLSIVLGVLGALTQKELKRLIAYSSIAHSGFIFFTLGDQKLLSFYLIVYAISSLGIFGTVSQFGNFVYLEDLKGTSKKSLTAFSITVFLLSFAGIPLMGGFFAKYLSFLGAINLNWILPLIVAAIGSIISVYFYFSPIVKIYIEEQKEIKLTPTFIPFISLILALSVIILGIFPDIIFKYF